MNILVKLVSVGRRVASGGSPANGQQFARAASVEGWRVKRQFASFAGTTCPETMAGRLGIACAARLLPMVLLLLTLPAVVQAQFPHSSLLIVLALAVRP
jgi:hypothetical protein